MDVRTTLVRALHGATVAAVGVLTACSTAAPTGTPGVERLGQYVMRYKGPDVQAVLGYRFAATNPGEDWLILDLVVTGSSSDAVEIQRDHVFLLTPSGQEVALASQKDFANAYGSMQSTLRREAIASDPLDYFPVTRIHSALQFFAAPGQGVTYDSAVVDDRRVCSGTLYFYLPDGWMTGHYTLGIDFPESNVRIPFLIAAKGGEAW
jgi:hypothetical protein